MTNCVRSRDLEVTLYPDHFLARLRERTWFYPRYTERRCIRCGNPLKDSRRGETCGACTRFKHFNSVNYIGLYSNKNNNDLKRSIWQLKNEGREFHAEILGMMLALLLNNEVPELKAGAAIVSVPSHPDDHPGRTYNPPDMIAHHLSLYSGIPSLHGVLEKMRPSSQKSLKSQAERYAAVEGIYEATGALDGEMVLLVDDVMTSGATLYACGRCCLEAGARRVDAFVAGRHYDFMEDRDHE